MSTGGNEQGGIHAKRIEAENVVSGVQFQGGDAQRAQTIRRGVIRAEELTARNHVSGLQYIADQAQASEKDLRHELTVLRTKLVQGIVAHEIPDATEAEDELAKPQPHGNRVLRKLDKFSQIVTRRSQTAEAAGKLGAIVIQLALLAAIDWQVAQKLLGG